MPSGSALPEVTLSEAKPDSVMIGNSGCALGASSGNIGPPVCGVIFAGSAGSGDASDGLLLPLAVSLGASTGVAGGFLKNALHAAAMSVGMLRTALARIVSAASASRTLRFSRTSACRLSLAPFLSGRINEATI
jgi:hypothetical protein